MTDAERAAGRRADFHVYYRRDGKLFFDAMWAATAEEAPQRCLISRVNCAGKSRSCASTLLNQTPNLDDQRPARRAGTGSREIIAERRATGYS
jgi:hypothetical protein